MEKDTALDLAKQSLEGLSVGDAFGELFFRISPFDITSADLPTKTWRWTDDTHMAISIVEVLGECGHIDQDALAKAFAFRFSKDRLRGYAGGAFRLLNAILAGGDWRALSDGLFDGGSYGNGSAMRVAPIGAYFSDDLDKAAEQARLSAIVTHAHIEGQAGAIAVAVAAAIAARDTFPTDNQLLSAVLPYLPDTITKSRIQSAMDIPAGKLDTAIHQLGTGSHVTCQDTVPFCLWCAAHNMHDYEQALWLTAKGLGDVDTTCAIVGGIVALSARNIPDIWLLRRESLPRGCRLG